MPKLPQKPRELFRREQTDNSGEITRAQKAVGILTIVLVISVIFWWLPRYQVRHTPGVHGDKVFDDEDAARKTLAQILGGTIVLLGLYFSAKTFGLSRESQITDRFTKAIEQLGKTDGTNPNIEVRLGAIYALERIAIDSPRDHWTIMEVLTAYVRQNAPLRGLQEKPRTDIQAILTVLGRRRIDPRREKEGQRLDLSGSHLAGANLREANLQRFLLHDANLQRADLYKANLREIAMDRADLKHADLIMANLQGAFIQVSCMHEANFQNADLRGAEFRMVDMREAHLPQADLRRAQLYSSNLWEANLYQANLERADLGGVVLQDAVLTEANLIGALGITADQVKAAAFWQRAHYSPTFRAALGLPTIKESSTPPTP